MITPDLILSEAVIYDLYKVFLSLLPSLPTPLLSHCLSLSLSLSLSCAGPICTAEGQTKRSAQTTAATIKKSLLSAVAIGTL